MRTVLVAYAIVWAVIFAYLVAQYMRISKLEREIQNIRDVLSRKEN